MKEGIKGGGKEKAWSSVKTERTKSGPNVSLN